MHRVSIQAGDETYVKYLPGPVIPFRDTRSIISPGRVAMGESHAYDLYSSRVTAQREDGGLDFLDVTHLAPARTGPKRPGLLGKFDVLGTLHLLTAAFPARDLSTHLHALLEEEREILSDASDCRQAEASPFASWARAPNPWPPPFKQVSPPPAPYFILPHPRWADSNGIG